MDSNITIHIVEPGGPTPVDPVVPNTGLFTHGIGGPEATILGITAAVIILAAIIAVLYYRNKKQGKLMSLSHKKATTIGLASLAAVVSLGTVAGLLKLGANAIDAEVDEAEEVAEVTDGELTIELGNEPVFAYVKSTVTVTEDMPAGYTLKAYSANPTLSAEGTDKTISMVTIPEDGLENAGSLTTSLTDNTWGLSIEEPESQADEIYFSLPATAEEAVTIKTIDDYSPTEAGDETTVYYGVYITPGLPYGTYTGANVSYEVEPHYITNLSFDGNGSDGGTAMEGVTIVAGDTITLPQNTFTKEGYSFTGWNTQADGEGKAYADEAEFTASLTESEDITLYAQWKLPPTIDNLTYMQDFASLSAEDKTSVLNSMSQETNYTLKDKRDSQDYTISKLKDGKIWMTKNLNLAGGTVITSELSNVPDNYTLPTANGFQSGNKLPASSTSGFNDDTKAFVYNSTKTSGTDCSDPGCYSYYSWTAATAGSGLSITADNTDAPYSICPKGWKLPNSRSTVAGNSDFYKLAVAYGMSSSSTSQSTSNFFSQAGPGTTPNFLLPGYYLNGSFSYGGSYGNYWSSTSYNSSNARFLLFYSSNVDSAFNGSRRLGLAVRCIAE